MNATNEPKVAGTRRMETRPFFGEVEIIDVEVRVGGETRIVSARVCSKDQPTKLWLDATVFGRFRTGNKVHVDRHPMAWLQADGKTANIGHLNFHNRNIPVSGWYDEKAANEANW